MKPRLYTYIGPNEAWFLREELGASHNKHVYHAVNKTLRTKRRDITVVAVKPEPARIGKRLKNQTTVLKQNIHPAFPRYYKHWQEGQWHFLAKQFIRGRSLCNLITNNNLPSLATRMGYMAAAADAIGTLHQNAVLNQRRGVVHRDVKADNIIIGIDGRVYIIDLEHVRTINAPPEHPNMIIGTLEYFSPEQIYNIPLDQRSDIYNLGVTTYLAITGDFPFKDPDQNRLLQKHCTYTFPEVTLPFIASQASPQARVQEVGQAHTLLNRTLQRMTAKIAGDRFFSMALARYRLKQTQQALQAIAV